MRVDHKEGWMLKNWCFWTVVSEKTLESPLDCKEIQPVHPKGDQSWVFIGRTDVEAETPILWPPNVKSWLIWKDPDAGKDWRQEEKRTTEDKLVDGITDSMDMSLGELLSWWWTGRPSLGEISKTTEWSLLISKEIQPVNPKREYSLEGLMLKVKLQYFGHLMPRTDSFEKTLILGKIEGITEDEMVEWHHWLNGHESKQTLGDSERQGNLACCSPWGGTESNTT